MNTVVKYAAPLVLLALVVAGVFLFLGGEDKKVVSAMFPRTISLYEGSDVRVLGVAIGAVEKVEPRGTLVEVTMSYPEDVEIPSDASALIISPAVVGDRYVQLTPVYDGGDVLEDGATISAENTETPIELDDIYSSLDELNVALGPDGANQKGALNDLVQTTADNFGGQGEQFNRTIKDFSRLSQTLDNNKEELFDSTEQLGDFINTLAENDTTVRDFNQSLSSVSDLLAGERENLTDALRNLSVGLGEVNTFVKDNKDVLRRNIAKVNRVAKVFVKQRKNLREVVETAPLALNNLYLTYNPDAGTLDTRNNFGPIEDQLQNNPTQFICALVASNDPDGEICNGIGSLGLPRVKFMGADAPATPRIDHDPTLGGLVGVTR